MAAQTTASDGFAPILKALATMQSNVAGKEKADAHSFLEKFQKSVCRIQFHPSIKPNFYPVRSLECYSRHPARL
jgi:hypothetical protein